MALLKLSWYCGTTGQCLLLSTYLPELLVNINFCGTEVNLWIGLISTFVIYFILNILAACTSEIFIFLNFLLALLLHLEKCSHILIIQKIK